MSAIETLLNQFHEYTDGDVSNQMIGEAWKEYLELKKNNKRLEGELATCSKAYNVVCASLSDAVLNKGKLR